MRATARNFRVYTRHQAIAPAPVPNYDGFLSNVFAFKFNLRRYTMAVAELAPADLPSMSKPAGLTGDYKSSIVSLTPHGQTFDACVSISVPYDVGSQSVGMVKAATEDSTGFTVLPPCTGSMTEDCYTITLDADGRDRHTLIVSSDIARWLLFNLRTGGWVQRER